MFATLAVLLILSGFFSGSETAMMALNRYRLKHLSKQGHRGARLAQKLLERPDTLIGVILIGNNFVNNFAATLHEDNQGRIWVGSEHGGLNCLDRDRGHFSHYLTTQRICSMHTDRCGSCRCRCCRAPSHRSTARRGSQDQGTTASALRQRPQPMGPSRAML